MRKQLLTGLVATIALLFSTLSTQAKNGYNIQLHIEGTKDTMLYLAHYYGKALPTIYKTDSARIDKNGNAVLKSSEETLGGIYLILLSDKKTYFEFLLNNGDDITINTAVDKLPDGIRFKNSPENDRFMEYVGFLKAFSKSQQELQAQMTKAKTAADTAKVRGRAAEEGKKLVDFRRDYVKKNPGTLLSNIFKALETPQIPEGRHLLPNGDVDSNFTYTYYKAHYWDGFDFKDDRLIHTPIFDAKLEEYFTKLVLPYPDSMQKEADWILSKTRGRKELFKYALWWITRNAETSKIMGMDEVFVYMVENYYMKGDAYWLDRDALNKYIERASKIAPNVIGNLAPEIRMPDMNGKMQSMSAMPAKYTLVIFWSVDCGHCQKEIPRIDSVYRAVLKKKGVKIYAVSTEGESDKWKNFVKEHKLEDWVHVSDPEHTSDFRSKYDVYSTPVLYLLDEKKIIQGKRLDYSNIGEVVKMLEEREKNNAKN